MKVYCAGKVQKNGWRDELCDIRGMASGSCGSGDVFELGEIPILPNGWIYAGPIVVACDHGCFHGESQHGQLSRIEKGVDSADRRRVFERCLRQIAAADAVFVWIDTQQIEGTLFEIGYAAALNKPIIVGFGRGVNPELFWFMRECVVASGEFDSALDAYNSLAKDLSVELAVGELRSSRFATG